METTSLVSLLCSLPALLLEVFVGVLRFLPLPKEILSFNSNLKKKSKTELEKGLVLS